MLTMRIMLGPYIAYANERAQNGGPTPRKTNHIILRGRRGDWRLSSASQAMIQSIIPLMRPQEKSWNLQLPNCCLFGNTLNVISLSDAGVTLSCRRWKLCVRNPPRLYPVLLCLCLVLIYILGLE